MGMLLYTYSGHSGTVFDIAWSPDGSRIASAGLHEAARENLVDIWDAFTGTNSKTYGNFLGEVGEVAWSPDQYRIASCDGTAVQLWGALTGDPFVTYRGHANTVHAVVWSPDGKHIASAGRDKTVQVWLVEERNTDI